MKGAAERPANPDATADPRTTRQPEGAAFASERLPGRRALPPVLVLGFVALLGAIVVVGVGGQIDPRPAVIPPVAVSSARPSPTGPGFTPVFLPDSAPMATSGPGPIQLQANRHSSSMFVHGDVFVERVTWVFVSLQDDAGRVAGWASVSVPGAAGPAASSGPSLRFDLDLAVPATVSGTLSVVVNAYDTSGRLIASARLEVGATGAEPSGAANSKIFDFGVRREGNDVFVHGTVSNTDVHSIAMALRDERGRATEWTTVPVSADAAAQGADRSFDARIRIPEDLASLPTWIEASAYAIDGSRLGPPRNVIVGGSSP